MVCGLVPDTFHVLIVVPFALPTMALPAQMNEDASAWDKALYAFLAEKARRSGSLQTQLRSPG